MVGRADSALIFFGQFCSCGVSIVVFISFFSLPVFAGVIEFSFLHIHFLIH